MPKWDISSGRGATHFQDVRRRAQTGPVSETVFFTEPGFEPDDRCATNRLSYYFCIVQAGTGGQLKLRIKWTDNSGVQQTWESASIQTNILGDVTSETIVVHVAYDNNVLYEIVETGEPTGYKYDLFLHAEHM